MQWLTNSFSQPDPRISDPQEIPQKFIASVFTDILQKMNLKGHLSTQATRHNTEGIWRGFVEQLVSRESCVWDLQRSQEQQNAINCLSGTQPGVLDSLGFLWNYFCKSWSLSFLAGKKKPSPGVTVLGVLSLSQSPKVAGASQSCPSQSHLETLIEEV